METLGGLLAGKSVHYGTTGCELIRAHEQGIPNLANLNHRSSSVGESSGSGNGTFAKLAPCKHDGE